VCVTETWLCDYTPASLIIPPGYRVYRCDHQDHDGGVALFVIDIFNVERLSIVAEFNHNEIISVDLSFNKVDYRIIGFYH